MTNNQQHVYVLVVVTRIMYNRASKYTHTQPDIETIFKLTFMVTCKIERTRKLRKTEKHTHKKKLGRVQ